MKLLKPSLPVLFAGLALLASGCATKYVTPGGPARLEAIRDPDIREAFSAKPEANFPASLVAVRVQSSGYRSWGVQSYGHGKYSVVTMRDFEDDAHNQRIRSQPGIENVVTMNRMLLPEKLDSEVSLRAAAAKLHADMLLIYTMDTQFFGRNRSRPLTVFTLGVGPTKDLLVSSTASAMLVDVRTGFIYGALEGTQRATRNSTIWTTRDAVEASRKETEKAAFEQLIGEFEPFWKSVAARYAKP